MDMSQYHELFVAEAREHLVAIGEQVLTLEGDTGNREAINALFRSAHSIKGMAASMEYGAVADLAHQMEDFMDRFRKGADPVDGLATDLLLECADLLGQLVEGQSRDPSDLISRLVTYVPPAAPPDEDPAPAAAVEEPRGEAVASPDGVPAPAPEELRGGQTIRVRTGVLDHLVNVTGELLTCKQRLLQIAQEDASPRLVEATEELSRLVRELQGNVLAARLMPLAAVTATLPRAVRDLARKVGKKAALVLAGTEIELDRAIIESLSDPLLHLLRNAVDHGLEPPDARLSAGKPANGTVSLTAFRERDQVVITVADDGRGMDPARLVAAAVAKGLISAEEGEALPPSEALLLTCRPGFSTAREVTDVSGRGVGMDAVQTAIQKVGGTLAMESEPGAGSRIQLRLPLTVAIIPVLLVAAAHLSLALPITAIEQTLDLDRQRIIRRDGRLLFIQHEAELPLLSLNRLLGRPLAAVRERTVPVLVCQVRGRRLGLVVDRFLGQQEVFVKPLGRPLASLRGLAGTVTLGTGEIVFLLDLPSLL